jgi:hypothetical protein
MWHFSHLSPSPLTSAKGFRADIGAQRVPWVHIAARWEARTRVVSLVATGGAVLIDGYRARGPVLLQVGTAFVTPTDGQLYDPTDGAVTVPTEVPDVP